MTNCMKIKIGTRGSELALVQTNLVIEALKQKYPQVEMEVVVIRTKGDKILNKPLIDFGGKGAFVTEFEDALFRGDIDLAVHSAKDMPMALLEGLEIAGTLKREDPRDVLVTNKNCNRASNEKLIIGTGSLRRQLQVLELYPNASCINIRGNVPTRLKKITSGECDGVILAAAGLKRLNLLKEEDCCYQIFSYDEVIPAGGQAIIAIEARKESAAAELIRAISDERAFQELSIEREILQLLGAGCHEAVGVLANMEGDHVTIRIMKEKDGSVLRVKGVSSMMQKEALLQQLVYQIKAGEGSWEKSI